MDIIKNIPTKELGIVAASSVRIYQTYSIKVGVSLCVRYITYVMIYIFQFENLDLKNIITPLNVNVYEKLLVTSGYDPKKTEYLVNGFRNGFSLKFEGNAKVRRTAANLKLRIGSQTELWKKVMTEVKAKRYAGPFKEVPFEYFIQSPIGLVPKDKGKKTRLIFHLSYPKNGDSVNSGIPHKYCTVKYPGFEEAVKLCLAMGKDCNMAKSDMSMAFRHVPLSQAQWSLTVLKAKHPKSGITYWFVDKCLPFGSSISCAIFQDFSNSVAYLVTYQTKKPNINYLDDFMFAALMKAACDGQVHIFLEICQDINFPVSLEKTEWGATLMLFLGLLLDSVNQVVCIPLEKIQKALDLLDFFLQPNKKKATVLQIQKLCGVLNFLCRCVIPGRVFLMRTYALTSSKLLPIQCSLLELILFEIQRIFMVRNQPFLSSMYLALFANGYYGMMRVGELTLTESNHAVKAKNVHLATNKDKLLIVLYSSKTHGTQNRPQKIKITSNRSEKSGHYLHRNFCPFQLMRNYIKHRGDYDSDSEQFFIFGDKSPVSADHARKLLKEVLKTLGLDPSVYGMHSLRIGRTSDLIKFQYSITEVKLLGCWRSNVIYKYIRNN